MLFAYPVEATAENWLHECLLELLVHDMGEIDAGRTPHPWLDCISQARRDNLKRYIRLEELRKEFLGCYGALTA